MARVLCPQCRSQPLLETRPEHASYVCEDPGGASVVVCSAFCWLARSGPNTLYRAVQPVVRDYRQLELPLTAPPGTLLCPP